MAGSGGCVLGWILAVSRARFGPRKGAGGGRFSGSARETYQARGRGVGERVWRSPPGGRDRGAEAEAIEQRPEGLHRRCMWRAWHQGAFRCGFGGHDVRGGGHEPVGRRSRGWAGLGMSDRCYVGRVGGVETIDGAAILNHESSGQEVCKGGAVGRVGGVCTVRRSRGWPAG